MSQKKSMRKAKKSPSYSVTSVTRMATVKVSEETYKKLNRLAGRLRSKTGRPVSVDEALDFILNKESRQSPSDFVGSWSTMNDAEEKEILRSLDRFWKGWKPQRD